MAANCKRSRPRTSEAKAKARLRGMGILDRFLNILDLKAFRKEQRVMTEFGAKEFGINTQWFSEEDRSNGKKAVPNKSAFRKVDGIRNIYYSLFNEQEMEAARDANIEDLHKLEASIRQKLTRIESLAGNPITDFKLTRENMLDRFNTLKKLDPSLTMEDMQLIIDYADSKGINRRVVPVSTILASFINDEVTKLKMHMSKLAPVHQEFRKEFVEAVKPFLKELGVSLNFFDDMRELYDTDEVAVTHIIEKAINMDKAAATDQLLADQVGHVYLEMLGRNNSLYSRLYSTIQNWEGYEAVYEEFKSIDKSKKAMHEANQEKDLATKTRMMKSTTDIDKIKRRAMARLIGGALYDRYNLDTTTNSKLKEVIERILEYIRSFISQPKNLSVELVADDVAKKILAKDVSDFSTELPEGFERKSWNNSLENQDLALEILDWFTENGGMLTGSLVLRKYGTLYRSPDEAIHDLDFNINYDVHKGDYEAFVRKFRRAFPALQIRHNGEGNASILPMDDSGSVNYLGFVKLGNPTPIYDFNSFTFEWVEKGRGGMNWEYVGQKDSNGNITTDGKHEIGEVVHGYLGEDGKVYREEDIILIDFFFNRDWKETKTAPDKGLADVSGIFEAKLDMGRPKDMMDLLAYNAQKESLYKNGRYSFSTVKEELPAKPKPAPKVAETAEAKKLENSLLGFLGQLNIDVTTLEDYKKRYKKKFDKGLSIKGLAHLSEQLIALADGADINTLTEEVAHFAIEMLGDNHPMVQRLVEQVKKTDTYASVVRQYSKAYDGNETMLAKEAIGKILADVIQEQSTELKGIQALVRNLWRRIKAIFNANEKVKQELRKTAKQILSGDTTGFNTSNLKGKDFLLYEIDENLFKSGYSAEDHKGESRYYTGPGKNILNEYAKEAEDLLKVWKKKLRKFKQRGETHYTKSLERKINRFEILIDNKQVTLGLVEAVNKIRREADQLVHKHNQDIETIQDKNLNERAALVKEKADFIRAYKDIVDSLVSDLTNDLRRNETNQEFVEMILNELKEIQFGMNVVMKTTEVVGTDILAEALLPYASINSKKYPSGTVEERNKSIEELTKLLTEAELDIGFVTRWVDSLAESKDDALGMLDKLVKELDEEAKMNAISEAKTLIQMEKSLKAAGHNTEFMYEMWNDLPTGNILSELNMGYFREETNNFSDKMIKKYRLPEDASERNKVKESHLEFQAYYEEDPSKFSELEAEFRRKNANLSAESFFFLFHQDLMKNYRKEWADWYEVNTEINDNYKGVIEQKAKIILKQVGHSSDFTEKGIAYILSTSLRQQATSFYGDKYKIDKDFKPTSTQKAAQEYFNDWLNDNRMFNLESQEYIYIRELSQPKKDKYANDTFSSMTSAQREYYDKYIKMREEAVDGLPVKYQQVLLAPQVRKDTFERGTGVKNQLKQMTKDALQKREGQDDWGALTDEMNNPVNVVPVYYFRRLEDPREMSLDLTSSFIQQISSIERYKSLTNSINLIELAGDVLERRGIPTGKFDVIGKVDERFAGDRAIQRGKGGYAYQRWMDYVKMNVYGQKKADQGDLKKLSEVLGFEVDQAKAIDLFGKYVAINNLALNLFAGVANVGLGNILTRQEAIAGKYFKNKNLMWADKTYWANMNDIVGAIGNPDPRKKMPLFLELVDVLNDYAQNVKETNLDRSWFKRMMTSSTLFFMNHMGEHQIQTRTALALADTIKLKYNGTEINLYDAYEVDGNRLRLKEGVTKEDGSEFTNKDLKSYILKHKAINQSLHGIYNDMDKAALQQFALGRLAFMFRKWLRPGWNRRMGKKYFNYVLETDVEGYYRTFARLMWQTAGELREMKFSLLKNYKDLSTEDKQNVQKALYDVMTFAAFTVLAGVLSSMKEEDDDENWALNFAAYEAYRLRTEVSAFWNIKEGMRIVSQPFAGMNVINDVTNMLKTVDPMGAVFNEDPFFRRMESGELYGVRNARRIFPLWKNVAGILYPEEKLKFYNK